MRLPRLRPLEASKVEEDGATYLALRDIEGYSRGLVMLPPLDALIAARLDGRKSAEQIAAEVCRQTGVGDIPLSRIEGLVKTLDENYMLESERFEKMRAETLAAFHGASERPAALAGLSYASDAATLEKSLDAHFSLPGAPNGALDNAAGSRLTGLVSPHIDYARGKLGYAWAYNEVLRSGLADLYVILGVAHATPATPLVLTQKDFGTPFGPARVDRELARALAEDAPYDLCADELTHRREHSIELQAVYLKYAQRKLGGDFKILPILASSCDLMGGNPGERAEAVLTKLEELLRDRSGTICLLAGVDFAHIGPCFGDDEDAGPDFLARVERQDRTSIDRILAADAGGFLESVMADGNQRRVCGVSALHAFSRLHSRLFPGSKGTLLHYGHAADPTGGEVTFASAAFLG